MSDDDGYDHPTESEMALRAILVIFCVLTVGIILLAAGFAQWSGG